MSTTWIVLLLSLTAALAFAMSSSLKHLSAASVPDAQSLHLGKLGGFIRATVTHRLWLAGIGCDIVGLASQTVALHLGALAVVQFLLLSSLLFALVLRARFGGHRITRGQAAWAAVLTASLAGFLLLASPTPPSAVASTHSLPVLVGGVLAAVAALSCIVVGWRQHNRARAAVLFGIAVGIIYAVTAALLKSVTDVAARGLLDLVTSWQLYTLIAVGAAGLILAQLAFQAGPLAATLPATATVDPIASLAIGVFIYQENLRPGLGVGLALVLLLAVLVTAVVKLNRTTMVPAASRS